MADIYTQEQEEGEEEEEEEPPPPESPPEEEEDGYKIPKGPRLPRSAPDLMGLSEGEIAAILRNFSDDDIEDLFNKNTMSFRCLHQELISRSSLMRHILYHFPELEDPGIDDAFDYVEPEPQYDTVGIEKYKSLCKDMNIVPISRVIRSLETETMNLKYYGLSDKQIKAISSSVMFNTFVKHLVLQDNWISPESATWLGEMLRENNTLRVLNMQECRLGANGLRNCIDGLSLSQSLRELDMSYNDLGDEGVEILIDALHNINLEKLNLGHNHLGELSGKLLGDFFKASYNYNTIDYLDLSWNDLYTGKALKFLCDGLSESPCLKYLNLSWNGIGRPEAMGPIVKYVKNNDILEHLDLSFNRIMGKLVLMTRAMLNGNRSLVSVNLGFNLITPEEAIILVNCLKKDKPLEYMDLQNIFVKKEFLPIWKRLTNMGKSVRIEGILENWTIQGPDRQQLVFERCKFLAQKPKKKKKKKDFGSDFIWNLPEEVIDKQELKKKIKKAKIKLDKDLIDWLGDTFSKKKNKVDLKLMHDSYLDMYPYTQPPAPPKKKKGKKGKKGKKVAIEELPPSTEEKAIGTGSSLFRKSSLVTSKAVSASLLRMRASAAMGEPTDPEEITGTMDLDRRTPSDMKADRRSKILERPKSTVVFRESEAGK